MNNENIENINSTNDETIEEEVENVENTEDTNSGDFDKIEEQNKKLYARAKRAEDEVKELKNKLSNYKPNNNSQEANTLTRDEAILFAQGLGEKDVSLLNKISKVEGISLLEAKESEVFKLHQETQAKKKREEETSLRATKGSNITKNTDISNMDRDAHKKLWLEMAKKTK